jgi:multicomponent Na+:H+ antiporter subunit B
MAAVEPRRDLVREEEPLHRPVRAGVLVAAMVVALSVAVVAVPRDHAALPAIARYAMVIALPRWHTTEPVNEVVYGTRGFDTFGETFLLLAAVVGITTITRAKERRRGFIGEEVAGRREQAQVDTDRGGTGRPDGSESTARAADDQEQQRRYPLDTPDDERLGTPAPEQAEAMSVVVRGAVRLVAPLLLVAGLYLVAEGYSPGGGFPGGLVLLGVVLLAYVAYGYSKVEAVIRPDVVEPIELGGALLIVAIEVLGLVFNGSFSANFLPLAEVQTIPSGGLLQAFSGSELIEVGTGLTLAVFGLLGMGHDWSDPPEPAGGGSRGS